MVRPSKSKIWLHNSILKINLKSTDEVLHKTTDEKGCVQTNVKKWSKHKATVILGAATEYENYIEVPVNATIWTCDIGSWGRLSALTHEGKTYSNEDVTVIVHTV